MSALIFQLPYPSFFDRDGLPLKNGYVWIGAANLEPRSNPVAVYYDAALTIPAAQPLRTVNGFVSRAGSPAQVYINASSFSILVQDSKAQQVWTEKNAAAQIAKGEEYAQTATSASGTATAAAAAAAASATEATTNSKSVGATEFSSWLGGPEPLLAPNQTFIDAIANGTCKIVVAGDSISEGASHYYVNGWVSNFTEMLQLQIPQVTWQVVNLSIGGRNLSQLASATYTASPEGFAMAPGSGQSTQLWPTGSVSGKSWRDHVKDEAPDLVIIAHQENQGNDADETVRAYEEFKAYANTWTKKPWLSVVSCFIPTKDPARGGDYAASQRKRQMLADIFRHIALRDGLGLIDVNAIMRKMRDGVRREVAPFIVDQDVIALANPAKYAVLAGASPTLNLAVGLIFNTPSSIVYNATRKGRDVDAWFDVQPNAGSIFNVDYRLLEDGIGAQAYTARYTPSSASAGLCELYYGTTQIGFLNVSGLSGTLKFRIKATGPRHELWINNVKRLDVLHETNMYDGLLSVGFAVGTGTIVQMSIAQAAEFVYGDGVVTDTDIFGTTPQDLAVATGDGVHHMTDFGVYQVYLPAVQKYIDQLKKLFDRPLTITATGTALAAPPTINTPVTLMSLSFKLPAAKFVAVHLTLPFKNLGLYPGIVKLQMNGVDVDFDYLRNTQMIAGDANSPTTASVRIDGHYLAAKGANTVSAVWFKQNTAALETGGAVTGARTLAVTL